jgi:Zn-dependent peptidase ImmA (M78 family)
MLGFGKPRLPIGDEIREWVDCTFARLEHLLGSERMLQARVLLPTQDDFPDRFDGTQDTLPQMVARVAQHMQVPPEAIVIELYDDASQQFLATVPMAERESHVPAGFYQARDDGKAVVAVHRQKLKEPLALVATIAHELGHVILLGGGLVDREAKDMEPMNDLLTVFLGMGVFTANASFQFSQFTETYGQGWRAQRQGYLPEPVFGYALARFAHERGEVRPDWAKFLSTNVRTYFKHSAEWLRANAPMSR